MPKSVLYFPSIEFQDEGWLKSALCIWDRVHRIVPPGYTPHDSDEVKRLQDHGLIESISLTHEDTEAAANSFQHLLENCECRPAALFDDTDKLTRLHHGKVGGRLQELFESMSTPLQSDDEWYGIPQELCHGYMMHLAESAATRRGIPKVTDSKDSFSISSFFDTGGEITELGYFDEDPYAQAVLGLTTVVPNGASHLSAKDLVAFRDRTTDGRRSFAEKIDRLAIEISEIEDPIAAKQRLEDAIHEFERSRKIIAEQSGLTKNEIAETVICVGIVTALATMSTFGAAGGDPFAPIPLATGATLGLVASLVSAGSKWNQPQLDPARSYYLTLEDQTHIPFISRYRNRSNDFWGTMEEFVND